MGSKITYTCVAEFKKMSSAVECVGILKHKNIDDGAKVFPGDGVYLVKLGDFKAKKSAEDVLTQIHSKTSYTFKISQEKHDA